MLRPHEAHFKSYAEWRGLCGLAHRPLPDVHGLTSVLARWALRQITVRSPIEFRFPADGPASLSWCSHRHTLSSFKGTLVPVAGSTEGSAARAAGGVWPYERSPPPSPMLSAQRWA